MINPVYDLILGFIEGCLENQIHIGMRIQLIQTRAQKREESKPYAKLKVPEALLTTPTANEMKITQQEDRTLDKV